MKQSFRFVVLAASVAVLFASVYVLQHHQQISGLAATPTPEIIRVSSTELLFVAVGTGASVQSVMCGQPGEETFARPENKYLKVPIEQRYFFGPEKNNACFPAPMLLDFSVRINPQTVERIQPYIIVMSATDMRVDLSPLLDRPCCEALLFAHQSQGGYLPLADEVTTHLRLLGLPEDAISVSKINLTMRQ